MKRRFKAFGAMALSAAMVVSMIPADTGKAYTPGNYSYFDEYSTGWQGGIKIYKGGKAQSVAQSGLNVYDTYEYQDNPFVSEIDQAWDADTITLTQPVSYTTTDGQVHRILLSSVLIVLMPAGIVTVVRDFYAGLLAES